MTPDNWLPPKHAPGPFRKARPARHGPWTSGASAGQSFTPVTVTRYGTAVTLQAAALTCLWYSVFDSRPVQVVLIRDRSASGCDLALVTTDTAATAVQVIERYASRWSIEVGHRWHQSSYAGPYQKLLPGGQAEERALVLKPFPLRGDLGSFFFRIPVLISGT